MGTPHSISDDKEKWQKVAILPHVAGSAYKTYSMEPNNIKKLTQSSLAFDQGGVMCPILTVCEQRETKLKQLFNSKRVMVCDVPSSIVSPALSISI